jgi:hypothetical protein
MAASSYSSWGMFVTLLGMISALAASVVNFMFDIVTYRAFTQSWFAQRNIVRRHFPQI